jgi:GntR family transcriptional regulator
MRNQSRLGDRDAGVVHRRGRPRVAQSPMQTSVRRAHVLLRAGIRSGALRRDEQLIETEIAEMLDTSRNAVRQALQMLEREGLLTRAPKNGTRVVRGIVGAPLEPRGARMVLAESELLECRAVRPPSYVRKRLALDDQTVMMGEHLVRAGGERVSVCVIYTPHQRGAECLGLSLELGESFRRRYDIDLGRSEDTLEAVACEARTSRLLGIDEGAPILLRETLSFGVDGIPRELVYYYNRGDRVSVTDVSD